jgi:hypothetical protein
VKLRAGAAVVLIAIAPVGAQWRRFHAADINTPRPMPPDSFLVVGLLGAWEDWDNPKRYVRKIALRMRGRSVPGLYVETADNHSRDVVRHLIRQAFDRDGNGKIDAAERRACALALYGQSFGGAGIVKLARELEKDGIPVRLTVQVDSVGTDDAVIPANVARAMNFYQHDPGPIRGRSEIRPADPARTQILGNLRLTYLLRFDIDLADYPAITRAAPLSHWRMDNDPLLWNAVEGLIWAELLRWRSERGL